MISRTATLLIATVFVLPAHAEDRDEAWVQRRVQQIKDAEPTAWRRTPWTASLLDARQASQKENKPVFVFAHDGNIDTGRC
ncbi:MAG TPA: hypothetical protein VMS17_20105 [Gemmataceae bacterium]|nr:hypothetical protein [Gemmataceae bacterium]